MDGKIIDWKFDMPCTQTGSIDGDRALYAEQTSEELFKENSKLTRIACEAMELLEKMNATSGMSDEPLDWYNEHKKIDQKRIDKEMKQRLATLRKKQLRKSAINKLSKEEKKALGL